MPPAHVHDYRAVGLNFATALARRDYATAYAMTSSEYQRNITAAEMRAAFEAIVPTDWRTGGPGRSGRHDGDVAGQAAIGCRGAYVSIGGEVYSEAVIVVVALESDTLRIRTVEFGRP
jgi:hypothetical protein